MRNRRIILTVALAAILLCEVIVASAWSARELDKAAKNYEKKEPMILLGHERAKEKLTLEYEKQKYLATGENVYERVHNTQDQSIVKVLDRLAKEALPKGWDCDVRVEEFTNVILLIRLNLEKDTKKVSTLLPYLYPLVNYGSPYLRNVAVFDKKHKCYLFFDERALEEVKRTRSVSEQTISRVKRQGVNFRRYDSIEIPFKRHEGHIYVWVEVSGERGVENVLMMLDTGASSTDISLDIAGKTGADDLQIARKRRFMTAKGPRSCPMVQRTLSVRSVQKTKEVGVSDQGHVNLLGVDFFEDLDYLIDSSKGCIYVWSK